MVIELCTSNRMATRSTSPEDGIDVAKTRDFRCSLAKFECPDTPLRRSPRKRTVLLATDSSTTTHEDQSNSAAYSRSPRKRSTSPTLGSYDDAAAGSKRTPKKGRRGYAAPALYAHLHGLQDYLAEELDGEG